MNTMNLYNFYYGRGGRRMLRIQACSLGNALRKATNIYKLAGWTHKPHIVQVSRI